MPLKTEFYVMNLTNTSYLINHAYNYLVGNLYPISIGQCKQGEVTPFKSYLHRYATPYMASKSSSPLWYSVRRASTHIIVLSSYSPFGNLSYPLCIFIDRA